jgi:uncharacterized protein involved in exopolysaccharide biosynthesis
MNKTHNILEEIDLRFIVQILIKRKFTIIIIALLFTMSIAIKAWTAAPIYSGNVYLEIGEVVNTNVIANNSSSIIIKLDSINNLKEITKVAIAASDIKAASDITAANITIQNGTDNVLKISMESTNPEEIQSKLVHTVKFILTRHEEKAKLYQNTNSKIRMTKVISNVNIVKDPNKPKKTFIIGVSFFGGLVLGVFLAFLQEFIANKRKYAQNDDK